MPENSWSPKAQWATYTALASVALILTLLLLPGAKPHFERFFGGAHPLMVVLAAGVIGAACLAWLWGQYGFEILRRGATLRGVAWSALFATVLGIAIVIADLINPYPQEMNVPFPQALAFYPAVGFVAEIVFHVLPLTVVLLLLWPLRNRVPKERLVWAGILIVAVAEPTFQVLFDSEPFSWADVYTWVHVFAIALLQLSVFRRFDFTSMYVFRLIYYAYWHIIWGVLRLELLF